MRLSDSEVYDKDCRRRVRVLRRWNKVEIGVKVIRRRLHHDLFCSLTTRRKCRLQVLLSPVPCFAMATELVLQCPV
jgi:hypothetical protein